MVWYDLVERQDDEGASAGGLDDERQVARVDGAEAAVVRALREPNAFVAVLLLGGATVHVPELGARHEHLRTRQPRTD